MLNANYITCIVLTLIGTLVISLYAYEADVIEPNSIYFSTAYAFVISNFLSIPIAFSQFTELRRVKVPYGIYVFTIIILVPFLFSIAIVLVNYFVLSQSSFPDLYSYILNIGFLIISIVILIVNYFKQLNKINTRKFKGRQSMKLEHITKKYGSNVVLNDIDFDFGDSRIVGLIGKTVLVKQPL